MNISPSLRAAGVVEALAEEIAEWIVRQRSTVVDAAFASADAAARAGLDGLWHLIYCLGLEAARGLRKRVAELKAAGGGVDDGSLATMMGVELERSAAATTAAAAATAAATTGAAGVPPHPPP